MNPRLERGGAPALPISGTIQSDLEELPVRLWKQLKMKGALKGDHRVGAGTGTESFHTGGLSAGGSEENPDSHDSSGQGTAAGSHGRPGDSLNSRGEVPQDTH